MSPRARIVAAAISAVILGGSVLVGTASAADTPDADAAAAESSAAEASAGAATVAVVAATSGDQLRFAFDQGDSLAAGTRVTDVSGVGNHGTVRSKYGGTITPQSGFAKFPNPCTRESCPNAMIEVADNPSLDPGTANFEWGARIRMKSSETADGENVLQKGRWGDAGGQWKLQVDKIGGKPSCVVSGFRNGSESRVMVKASVGVADDTWHEVICRRTAGGVEILVDGVVRGSAGMPVVTLSSSAAVTIGAKEVVARDNDQFLGRLDDIFMRLI
jgi:hypothetical protein